MGSRAPKCSCFAGLAAMPQGASEGQLKLRVSATECWAKAEGAKSQIGAACDLFRAKHGRHAVTNVSKFITRWKNALITRQDLKDAARRGAPRKVTDEQAMAAVEIVWAGYKVDGQQEYWDNINAALAGSSELRALKEACKGGKGVTARTLFKRMCDVEKRMVKRRLEVRRELSEANMAQRKQAAALLLRWPPSKLDRLFLMDAATVYLLPKHKRVLAPPEARLVYTDKRLGNTKRMQKLKFYACISPIFGPVLLHFVTGTTGLPKEKTWMVSVVPIFCDFLPVCVYVCVTARGSHALQDCSNE